MSLKKMLTDWDLFPPHGIERIGRTVEVWCDDGAKVKITFTDEAAADKAALVVRGWIDGRET